MSDFIERMRRTRLLFAVAGVFLSGFMVALGVSMTYHWIVITSTNETWLRLLDDQQKLNSEKLDHIARATDENTQSIQILLEIATGATKKADEAATTASGAAITAKEAANTAKQAATTASGAAQNAARANIKVREFPTLKLITPTEPK